MENTNKEFPNIIEIVDEVLHSLHQKDVELILSYRYFETFIEQQYEFLTHLVNWYSLANPNNPVKQTPEDPYATAVRIARRVFEALREIPSPNVA